MHSFLSGGGEQASLIQSKDWSATPLGPIESWPQSLRTTVSLCLASNFPINIIWGPENTQIYNDGYKVVCGESHPRALGEGYHVTWASAWPAIGGPFTEALEGQTSFLENQRMFLTRNGYLEETFFTFSISPIRDETGGIGGLFHPVTETTVTILAERRTRALRDLTGQLAVADDLPKLIALTVRTLAEFNFDIPFLLFYEWDAQGKGYRLAQHSGIAANTAASPAWIDAADATPWPLGAACEQKRTLQVDNIEALFAGVACGPYPEPSLTAFVLPLVVPDDAQTPLILVAGASPRLPMNDIYRGLYELLGAALSAALATVRAREYERQRADALAAIDQAKTTFFTNISHEFRTPLTLMLGPLEESLALGDTLPEDERERVTLAYRNGQRLLKLVNSLLEFSRIEAGRAQATYAPVDLPALTADLASNFRSACERAGLALLIDTTPLPEAAYVDRDMWEKVVLNLISNAFKFTLAGHIRVSIAPSADGSAAQVCVSDTGTGIAAHELPRLFERFHQIENPAGRSFEGSGIGLALVDELVRLQGGTLEVSSEVGVGTTFSIRLPLGSRHVPKPLHTEALQYGSTTNVSAYVEEALGWLPDASALVDVAQTHPEPEAESFQGHVLLADDNADMRAYVARLLYAAGLDVETVTDGQAALQAARENPPQLILTDVMMPVLDGFGLLRAVREDPRLQTTPVILLSARAGEEARAEGLAAGADDYLIKPFSARELVSRVTSHLERARNRRVATLRESEARLRLAIDAGQIGEWELDIVTDSTVRAERHDQIFGYHERVPHWGMQTFLEHVLPADRDAVEATFTRAVTQGSSWDFQCRIRRVDDQQVRWILVRSMPQLDAHGRTLKMFGLVQDITDQKRVELGMQALNETLEQRITEAMEERSKAEEQLRQAQKLEALGQLTGGVAHDFNNLLTVIRSSLDLLERPELPEARRSRYLAAISDTVNRAARLTGQLLAFARRQALKPQAFDVSHSVTSLVEMIESLCGAHIRVITELAPYDCFVYADSSQFDSALVNVVVNARDAMKGVGTLTIAVASVDTLPALRGQPAVPGAFVAIAVSDTGSGIRPEHLERIFEPFFTTKNVGQGTGLGLSQVFGFAKQSGGEVRVSTEFGRGSTFTLYLPKVIAQPREPEVELEAAPMTEGRGTHVLVVEDNVEVGTFATQALEELGFQATWAMNAEQALKLLSDEADAFDVVFSDVMMPGMNGLELAKEIQRLWPALPIVLTSGYSHVLAQQGTHGFDLLHKPYSIHQLLLILRRACSTPAGSG
ncbi:response regulator [Pseudomonas sp. R3-18-08]|uniref:ATP-binding response regulator n=1 Tax=Pseudomonas sp. R3-18-08 TaxID=1173283 RepID=UPI000F6B32E8|nr:response regulator [Pseudomonas sp. R3-18-08]AZF16972.1 Sensory box histidine kinase/response regulator [Pseudomonas sp. R3-18-08]